MRIRPMGVSKADGVVVGLIFPMIASGDDAKISRVLRRSLAQAAVKFYEFFGRNGGDKLLCNY